MERLKEYGELFAVALIGALIVACGLWRVIRPSPPVVEVVHKEDAQDQRGQGLIVVDLEGAVEKSGVYSIKPGTRVGEVITMAGGLSAEADREWVAQYLNLADIVKEGDKIFIPKKGAVGVESEKSGRVNVNTSSQSQLESLAGIGEARAKAIIANRPYRDTTELGEKAGIPSSVLEEIKEQISVY